MKMTFHEHDHKDIKAWRFLFDLDNDWLHIVFWKIDFVL